MNKPDAHNVADANDLNEALALKLRFEGTQLIEASAGTGKTWTLSVLLLRALLEQDLRCSQILAITFTRAATAEIRSRVLSMLRKLELTLQSNVVDPDDKALMGVMLVCEKQGIARATMLARARRALVEFDDLSVFTIHGFYQRTLKEHALSTGTLMDAGVETEVSRDLEAIALDFWRKELAHPQALRRVCADEKAANALAMQLLNFKPQSEKQTIFSTPEQMARWLKNLLQRAPQVEQASVEVLEEKFAQQASAQTQAQQALQTAMAALRHSFLPEDIFSAIEKLREQDGISKSRYQLSHVKKRLADIAAWLERANDTSGEPPKCLEEYFTSAVLTEKTNALPSALTAFTTAVDASLAAHQAAQASLAQLYTTLRYWWFAVATMLLPQRLAARGMRSADSLASSLATALEGEQGTSLKQSLRARYQLVMVDEFQDTDTAQWSVLEQVFVESGSPLFLVGDPKQAIYQFRGADIAAYLKARHAAREVHALQQNFRTVQAVLSPLNTLFMEGESRSSFGDDEIQYETVQAARDDAPGYAGLYVQSFDATEEDNITTLREQAIANTVKVVQQLLGKGIAPSGIAVLLETNDDISRIAQALSLAGIASAARRQQSIANSFEALQLQWLLEALARPLDVALLKRLMLSPLWGGVPQQLDDEPYIAQQAEQIVTWNALARSRGIAAALEAVMRERKTAWRRLQQGTAEAEESLARLRQVAEVVQCYASNQSLDDALQFLQHWRHSGESDPRAYAPNASHELNKTDALPRDSELAKPRIASERPAVQLMTVHASKGLEFDAVVLPLLWLSKEIKPSYEILREDAAGNKRWDFGPAFDEEVMAQHQRELAGERARVAYVALTRARDVCVLVWPEMIAVDDAAAVATTEKKKSSTASKAKKASATSTTNAAAKVSKIQSRMEAAALAQLLGSRSWQQVGAIAFDAHVWQSDEQPSTVHDDASPSTASKQSEALAWPDVPAPWQTMSYSRWQRGLQAMALSSDQSDYTRLIEDSEQALELIAVNVPDHDESHRDTSDDTRIENALTMQTLELRFRFPRGAAAGRALHELMERLPTLESWQSKEALNIIENVLAQHAMPDYFTAEAVLQWLQEVMQASLPLHAQGTSSCLADLAATTQQREWEFHLPLEGASALSLQQALLQMGALSMSHLSEAQGMPAGFFTGFVDLVFEHQGRYYIADYKSNHLGDSDAAYARDALELAVQAHQYDAQAALYLLALHRHLRASLSGYQPEQHLGGAMMLFMRGMRAGSTQGIWSLNWNVKALLALDELCLTKSLILVSSI